MLSQTLGQLTKRLIGVGERPTVRITAKRIHQELNQHILPGDYIRFTVLGHELENIQAVQCDLEPDTMSYVLKWKTRQGTLHRYELPDEMNEEDLTALLVAMRIS